MRITGTHFNYYNVCHRKLWLFSNGIQMEHISETVYDGKLIHEYSYPQRPGQYEEIEIDGIKVDFYDTKNRVIHEIKRSNKIEKAHEWQLKYYIYVFERHGIKDCTGVLEYPTMRETKKVILTDDDRMSLSQMEADITVMISNDNCPPRMTKKICRMCSYYDFCFSDEPTDI